MPPSSPPPRLLFETKAVVDHRLRLCMHINRDNRGSPGAAYRAGVEPRRGGRSERPRGDRATQRVEGWKETGSDTEDRDHGGLERMGGGGWCSRAETLHANGAHLSWAKSGVWICEVGNETKSERERERNVGGGVRSGAGLNENGNGRDRGWYLASFRGKYDRKGEEDTNGKVERCLMIDDRRLLSEQVG